MIDDTLRKMEQRLDAAKAMKSEDREALRDLLAELKVEVEQLSGDEAEQADSIAGFAEASAREAVREQQDPALFDTAITGLKQSVERFEVSHPSLTGVVNRICHALADLGI